jgi:hypothetical protein
VTAGRGDRRSGRDDPRPPRGRLAPFDDRPLHVAEVADRRDARRELLGERGVDDRRDPAGVQFGQLLEGTRAAVGTQVHVGVDQPGEQRRAGPVDDLAVGRGGRGAGFDADDVSVPHQDEGTAGQPPFAVECDVGAISHQIRHGPPPFRLAQLSCGQIVEYVIRL